MTRTTDLWAHPVAAESPGGPLGAGPQHGEQDGGGLAYLGGISQRLAAVQSLGGHYPIFLESPKGDALSTG